MLISSSSIHHPLKPISFIRLSIRIENSPLSGSWVLIPITLIEREIRPNQFPLPLFFLIHNFSVVSSPIRQLNWADEIAQSGNLLGKFMGLEWILELAKLLCVALCVFVVKGSRGQWRYSVRNCMYLLWRSWAIFAVVSHLNIMRTILYR